MKKIMVLLAFAMPLMAQEGFDFKTLDKLGANAKNKTNIALDGDMLKLASGFLGAGKEADAIKPLVDNLRGRLHPRPRSSRRKGSTTKAIWNRSALT